MTRMIATMLILSFTLPGGAGGSACCCVSTAVGFSANSESLPSIDQAPTSCCASNLQNQKQPSTVPACCPGAEQNPCACIENDCDCGHQATTQLYCNTNSSSRIVRQHANSNTMLPLRSETGLIVGVESSEAFLASPPPPLERQLLRSQLGVWLI